MTSDPRFCPGAGATEIRIASALEKEGDLIETLDTYAYKKFATAFEVIPRILSDNAGLDANEIITKMYAKNGGDEYFGLDIEDGEVKESN